jgi:imidazolonepropionase-like amidohydrolase
MIKKYKNAFLFDTEELNWKPVNKFEFNNGKFSSVIFENNTIDFNKKSIFIVPGLTDAHLHITEEYRTEKIESYKLEESLEKTFNRVILNLAEAKQCGITTIRDLGGFKTKSIEVLKLIKKRGLSESLPRFITSGAMISRTNGHALNRSIVAADTSALIEEVEKLIAEGVDCIKLLNDPYVFHKEELEKVVDLCNAYNIKTSIHVFNEKAAKIAVDANVHCLEHAGDYTDKTISAIKQKGIFIVPTFIASFDTLLDQSINQANDLFDDADFQLFKKWFQDECYIVPKLIEADLKIVLGTDAGFPGTNFQSLIREMNALRFFGMKPKKIIESATKISAEMLGLENEIGVIKKGYSADYVVLRDNPLKSFNTFYDPLEVWCKGKQIV